MKEPEIHSEVWEYLLQLSSNIDAANKKSLQCCLLSLIQSLDHFLDNFSNVTFAQKTTCTISQNRGWYQCCYIVLNLIWNILCTSCSKGKGYTVTLLSLLSWYQILSSCTHFKVRTKIHWLEKRKVFVTVHLQLSAGGLRCAALCSSQLQVL